MAITGRGGLLIPLAVLLICVLLFLPFPSETLWWREAMNSGHVFLFILVSWLLFYGLRQRMPKAGRAKLYVLLFVTGLLIGLLVEYLQLFVHREASWADWFKDAAGLLAGIVALEWYLTRGSQSWWRQSAALGLFAALVVFSLLPFMKLSLHYWQRGHAFPVVMDFDAPWSTSFVRYNRAEKIFTESGLIAVRFGRGQYPGLSIIEVEPDWSSYSRLVMDVVSPLVTDASLVLRIDDRLHNQRFDDRFNQRFVIHPGENRITVPLRLIEYAPKGRKMDMRHINEIKLFVPYVAESMELEVGDIFLQ